MEKRDGLEDGGYYCHLLELRSPFGSLFLARKEKHYVGTARDDRFGALRGPLEFVLPFWYLVLNGHFEFLGPRW
jgi:hypothetical protein